MRCEVAWILRAMSAAWLITVACPRVGAQSVEAEPNQTKATATPVTLSPGEQIAGRSIGTSTSGGDASLDYWRIKTATANEGVYRYELALTSMTPGHVFTLRGRSQSGGVISQTSDTTLQSASAATNPARVVSWYGFGNQEEVYVRVGGAVDAMMEPITTEDYVGTLTRTQVTPTTASGNVFQGQIEVRVNSVSGSMDSEFWIYDANFNPLETNVPAGSGPAGADENIVAGVPAGVLSSARRTLTPGVYYVAVGAYQFGNHLPSPGGDFQSGQVTDFPNVVVSSVVNRSVSAAVTVSMTDSMGNTAVSPSLSFPMGASGLVQFVRFTITSPTGPALSSCMFTPSAARPGGMATITATALPGTSGNAVTTVTADLTSFGLSNAEVMALVSGDTYALTFAVPMNQTLGNVMVDITAIDGGALSNICTASVDIVPAGDECALATAISGATDVMGSLVGATASAIAPLCTSATIDTYFQFTPTISGSYVVRLTPTDFASLSVGSSCAAFDGGLFCQTISLTPTNTSPIVMNAGVPVFIRVACFAGDEAPFTLRVDSVAAGACCSVSTGACSITESTACVGGVYQGNGTVCTPTLCPQPGACCDNTNFVCTVVVQTQCLSPLVFVSPGSTCVPYPCAPVSNDECAGAITLTDNGLSVHSTLAATGSGNTRCGQVFNDVWYRWTAPAEGTVRFTTEGDGADSWEMYDGGSAGVCPAPIGANFACWFVDSGAWGELPVIAGRTHVFQVGRAGNGATNVSGINLWFVRSATGSCCEGALCTIVSESECAASGGTFGAGGVCVPNAAEVSSYPGASFGVADFSTTGATFNTGTITVADSFTVADVEVEIVGEHTFVGDLVLSLEKDGRKIQLLSRPGRRELNPLGASSALATGQVLTFADTGSLSLHAALVALPTYPAQVATGTYRPSSTGGLALSMRSTFNGVPAQGQWTLRASDWSAFDTGSLTWSLKLRRGGTPVCQVATSGRCCVGARCAIVSNAGLCSNGGSGFAGAQFTVGAASCNAGQNFTSPCCFADYNRAGGLTVQDVFDYLTDWFAMDPDANVEGDGVVIPTIQDVFDFLTAWFAGGC